MKWKHFPRLFWRSLQNMDTGLFPKPEIDSRPYPLRKPNDMVKGSAGAVSLTKNPSAFRKGMISGPEQARLLTEFEVEY